MNQIFHWSARVYYEDTDAGGIMYHARYLAFYERARTEMLRLHHISQQQLLLSEHVAFAVRRMAIEYIAPARLDDLLDIETKIIAVRKASITFAQCIYNQDKKLLSSADVLIACINPDNAKPIGLPKSISWSFING